MTNNTNKKSFLDKLLESTLPRTLLTSEKTHHLIYLSIISNADGNFASKNFLGALKQIAKKEPRFKSATLLMEIIRSVDNRVDTTMPQDIINAGKAELGKNISDFVKSREIVTEEDWENLEKLKEMTNLSDNEIISFANLAGVLLQEEAKNSIEFSKTKSVESRRAMSEINMKMNGWTLVFITRVISGKKIDDFILEKGLSYEHLESLYPKTVKMARVDQALNDMRDLISDLSFEVKFKRPVPNIWYSKLHEEGGFINDEGNIKNDLTSLVEKKKPQDGVRFLLFRGLPKDLQQVLNDGKQKLENEIATFGPVARFVFRNMIKEFFGRSFMAETKTEEVMTKIFNDTMRNMEKEDGSNSKNPIRM